MLTLHVGTDRQIQLVLKQVQETPRFLPLIMRAESMLFKT